MTVPAFCLKSFQAATQGKETPTEVSNIFGLRRQNLEFQEAKDSIVCGLNSIQDGAAHVERQNSGDPPRGTFKFGAEQWLVHAWE